MNERLTSSDTAALSRVTHRYPGEAADTLSEINLTIKKGEVVSLIGPSGAGKSSLLTLLDGRLRGWSGTASVLGHSLDSTRTPQRAVCVDIGFVFQEFALVEQATVMQNILNGRLGRVGTFASLLNRFSHQDHIAVATAMRDAGIAELADKRVDQISGGQRQRVAIARCLAQEPQLILADEPVSNLDPTRASQVLQLIVDTAKQRQATLIFSSHQPVLARRFSDRIVALNNGKVSFDGVPDELNAAQINRIYQVQTGSKTRLRLVG